MPLYMMICVKHADRSDKDHVTLSTTKNSFILLLKYLLFHSKVWGVVFKRSLINLIQNTGQKTEIFYINVKNSNIVKYSILIYF